MATFNLKMFSADRVFYDGPAEYINIPTVEGTRGVLAHHENAVLAVTPGILVLRTEDGKEENAVVSRGIVKIDSNNVMVLVNTIERPEEIDVARARKAEEAAKRKLKEQLSRREHQLAEAKLARAINRINASRLLGRR